MALNSCSQTAGQFQRFPRKFRYSRFALNPSKHLSLTSPPETPWRIRPWSVRYFRSGEGWLESGEDSCPLNKWSLVVYVAHGSGRPESQLRNQGMQYYSWLMTSPSLIGEREVSSAVAERVIRKAHRPRCCYLHFGGRKRTTFSSLSRASKVGSPKTSGKPPPCHLFPYGEKDGGRRPAKSGRDRADATASSGSVDRSMIAHRC